MELLAFTRNLDASSLLGLPPRNSQQSGSGKRPGPLRKPAPSYRHGTPSGPWPFLDIDDEVDPKRIEDPESHRPLSAEPCLHQRNPEQEFCWCKYPQAIYPNWTQRQQKKSKIYKIIEKSKNRNQSCTVYYTDVQESGIFSPSDPRQVDDTMSKLNAQWHIMTHRRPEGSRARVVFIDNLTGPALQMFGMRYNIEPFYFSSTIGCIPSRFQSHVDPGEGDHITLTLSFMRKTENPEGDFPSAASSMVSGISRGSRVEQSPKAKLVIDTQAPLPLYQSAQVDLLLVSDFLSVHMVRRRNTSTLISCHSGRNDLTTSAETLYERFNLCGKSVYWSSIFKATRDPTFLLLCLLWYVLYAWDEVMEALYSHICFLEDKVMTSNDLEFTQELHIVRAHLLHYESLLDEFRKTVEFVQNTDNPALDNPEAYSPELKETTKMLINKECETLLRDIMRLERSRIMQDHRLKNVMGLSFSLVNIEDSRRMAKLTEAAVRDSAAMKQIAYLTMVFLPSGFVAACFGMNVVEINPTGSADSMTLAKYFGVAIPLTAFTIWIIIAYHFQLDEPEVAPHKLTHEAHPLELPAGPAPQNPADLKSRNLKRHQRNFMWRLLWPIWLFMSVCNRRKMMMDTSTKKGTTRFGVRNKMA